LEHWLASLLSVSCQFERQHGRCWGLFHLTADFKAINKNGGHVQMQATEIEQEIRTFITENFLFGRSEALNDDTPLLGNVIDSTGVIELIVFVQQRFTISVDDEEVMTDNFGSVKNVVDFIDKKLRSRA
jgi:acyl carrier protein